jgi:hypothetical protein
MPKRLLFVLLAASLLIPGYGYLRWRRSELRALQTRTFLLRDGLRGESVTGSCGSNAGLAVAFAVGTGDDPPGRSGTVHVIERILAAWAAARPAEGIQRRVVSGSDYLMYSVEAPSEDILYELGAFASRVARPEVGPPELARARAEVLADIASRAGGDPVLTAETFAAESVVPSAGGGRRGGIASEVQSLEAGLLQSFWRAHLSGTNARVAIVSDIDSGEIERRMESAFAALPVGTPPTPRPPGPMTAHGTLVFGAAPSSVAWAVRAPAFGDSTFAAFLLLAARLETTPPAGGWTTTYDPLLDLNLLLILGQVRSGEAAEPAASRIRSEVVPLLERPLAAEDVGRAQREFALLLGSNEAETCRKNPVALAVARVRRAQLGIDWRRPAKALADVREEDLKAAAGFFAPDRSATVIAGGAIH